MEVFQNYSTLQVIALPIQNFNVLKTHNPAE